MNTLKLTHNDREVLVVLENVTYIENIRTNLGEDVTEIHFTNNKSLAVSESCEEIEKMIAGCCRRQTPQKKNHLGFDHSDVPH